MDFTGRIQFDNIYPSEVTITAFGDLAFHGNVNIYAKNNGADTIFNDVNDQICSHNILIGNLESVINYFPKQVESKKALLVTDSGVIESLKAIDIDLLSFANNHVKDAGDDGLLECINIVRGAKINIFGAGMNDNDARKPSIIIRNGLHIIAFAYADNIGQIASSNTPGCAEVKFDNIIQDITPYLKIESNIILISLHMDAEFQETPSPSRIKLCRMLADIGVHIVLCHHPHVIQGIEKYKKTLIVYSLGNYVTAITPYMLAYSEECNKSFHINISINKYGVKDVEVVPIVIDVDGRPQIASGENKNDILRLIHRRSESLGDNKLLYDNYNKMIRQCRSLTFRTIYWAIRKLDIDTIKIALRDIIKSKAKQRWLIDSVLTK